MANKKFLFLRFMVSFHFKGIRRFRLFTDIIFFDHVVGMVRHLGPVQTCKAKVLSTVDVFVYRPFILNKFLVNERKLFYRSILLTI